MNKMLRLLKGAWTAAPAARWWLVAVLAFSTCSIAVPGSAAMTLTGILVFFFGTIGIILGSLHELYRLLPSSWKRLLARAGIVAAMVTLFFGLENWRGWRAWQNYARPRIASGEKFELNHYIPKPIAAERNFFETPPWTDLHFTKNPTGQGVMWASTTAPDKEFQTIFQARHLDLLSWTWGSGFDLTNWHERLLGFRTRTVPQTDRTSSPGAVNGQSSAETLMTTLAIFDDHRNRLMASASRPEARFWVNYEDGWAALLPHVSRLNEDSRYLQVHALAALQEGQKETAAQDVLTSFRLVATLRDEPFLVSHRIRMQIFKQTLQPIWQGLADQQWNAGDLRRFDEELSKLDFLADYDHAIRGERAECLWALDLIRRDTSELANNLEAVRGGKGHDLYEFLFIKALRTGLIRFTPRGWVYQQRVDACMEYDDRLACIDTTHQLVSAPGNALPRGRSRFLALLDVVFSADQPSWFAHAQTCANLARTACALERFRLARGHHPQQLDELSPEFLQSLPHDLVGGEPLKYRLNTNGTFVLYSVGYNQADDGGSLPENARQAERITSGDWVWSYNRAPKEPSS